MQRTPQRDREDMERQVGPGEIVHEIVVGTDFAPNSAFNVPLFEFVRK